MTFSQIFWHNRTWDTTIHFMQLLLGFKPAGRLMWADIRTEVVDPVGICMVIAFFFGAGAPGTGWLRRRFRRHVPNWIEYGCYLLLISALTIESGSKFIYGQF
jgi:hypothetical protein